MTNDKKYSGDIARFTKTYGFIYCVELGRRIFFHVSQFQRATDPVVGERVIFSVGPANKPNLPDVAVNVQPTPDGLDAISEVS